MSDELDFSLPKQQQAAVGKSWGIAILLVVILIAQIISITLSVLRAPRSPGAPRAGDATAAESHRELAMRLEKQGLNARAASAWQEYLETVPADAVKSAKIWYRIGKLYQESAEYDKALESFYRSEGCFKLNEVGPEISRRIQECLEGLGKFAALRYELAERVGIDTDAAVTGDVVVAEIGAWKMTKSELDRRIEEQIERQLSQFAAYLPEEQRKSRKEAMLKQLAGSRERLQMLQQLIMEELLYRSAREARLHEDPETHALLRDTERKILAQRVIERELQDRIKITDGDVRTYYEANKSTYREPERAQISHILVDSEEKAGAVLNSLKDGEEFKELAKGVSLDAATADKGGEIEDWLKAGGADAAGIGLSAEAVAQIFAAAPGTVLEQPFSSDKGFHIVKLRKREAERQKSFEEVEQEARRALRAGKEREVQQRLMEELKDRYDVVIHFAQFADKAAEDAAAAAKDGNQRSTGP